MKRKLGFIDLRKEIELLADNVGFSWVALRTIDLNTKCTECSKRVGNQYETPPEECKTCFGTGHLYVDKLVRGFRDLSQPGFDFLSELGVVNTKTQVYIIEHDKYPKSTDFILELDLDEKTGQPKIPYKIQRVFKIQDAHPLRGGQPEGHPGRIEFFRCFVEERNFGTAGRK
ncbi:MAG: hypothetical protein D6710_08275 [Nitrospirae bacterium]|nr:MAG: hypothetical protein D6710_08275 [Nitrospirota bacterium]